MHPDALNPPQSTPSTSTAKSMSVELESYLPHLQTIPAYMLSILTFITMMLSAPILFLALLPPTAKGSTSTTSLVASLDLFSPYTLAATTAGATVAWNAYLLALGQSAFQLNQEKIPFTKTFAAATLIKLNLPVQAVFTVFWAGATQLLLSQVRNDNIALILFGMTSVVMICTLTLVGAHFIVKRACLIAMGRIHDGYERIESGDDDQFGCV